LGGNKLSDILHSWKSYTASEINKRLGRTGQFWMRESFDHIVRNQKSFSKIKEYIKNNPIKAGIKVPQASSLKGE
jgi:putative DNA methylase